MCVFYCSTITGIDWLSLKHTHLCDIYTCNLCPSAEGLHISTYFICICDHHVQGIGMEPS